MENKYNHESKEQKNKFIICPDGGENESDESTDENIGISMISEKSYESMLKILGLKPDIMLNERKLIKAYRRQMSIEHPDKGGNLEKSIVI
jgi:hypothetical protein